MKNIVCFVVFTTMTLGVVEGMRPASLAAQNVAGFSLSLGADANLYNSNRIGFGVRMSGDYRFGEMISIGSSALIGNDFNEDASKSLGTLEFTGNFRYYFFRDDKSLIRFYAWQSIFHIFLQAELGMAAFIVKITNPGPILVAGLAGGVRIALSRFSLFFIEPYVRIGFPYTFSIGITGGYHFPEKGLFW